LFVLMVCRLFVSIGAKYLLFRRGLDTVYPLVRWFNDVGNFNLKGGSMLWFIVGFFVGIYWRDL